MEKDIKNIRLKISKKIKQEAKSDFKIKCLSSIDSAFIESIKPCSIADNGYWKDCVYYLVHTILTKTIEEDFKPRNKYVALSAVLLKKVLGNETRLVVKTLLDKKIILTDGKYSKGITSYGYKINLKFFRKGHIVYKTLTNKKIKNRYKKFRQDYYEEQKELLYQNAHIVKWLLEGKITFLNNFAREYLDIQKEVIAQFLKIHYTNLSAASIADMLVTANFWSFHNTGEEYSKIYELPRITNKGHRLNSFITEMYSPLRNLLLYEELPLVYFDISNSQSFHFLAFLRSGFWKPSENKESMCLQNLNAELYDMINKKWKQDVESTIMFLEYYENKRPSGYKGPKHALFRKSKPNPTFSHLVMNGTLYMFIRDNFSGKFKKANGYDPFDTKDKAKKSFISMFNADNKVKSSKNTMYFNHFATLFPFEAKIINLLKKRSYKDFSILLQKIESNIMLGRVCKEIYDQNKSIPIFTIHDGILTLSRYENEVKSVLEGVYKNIIDEVPDLKRDDLRPSKLSITAFTESLIKKAKKITEEKNLQWIKPTPDFDLLLIKSYQSFYDKIKIIPYNWVEDELVSRGVPISTPPGIA